MNFKNLETLPEMMLGTRTPSIVEVYMAPNDPAKWLVLTVYRLSFQSYEFSNVAEYGRPF